MNSEELYRLLNHLLVTFPRFDGTILDDETHRWLGRLAAVLRTQLLAVEAVKLDGTLKQLSSEYNEVREIASRTVKSILFKAIANAELKAPESVRGAFIQAGSAFDALTALGKIFRQAEHELLIVDPYMSDTTLSDYCVLASENVILKLLADSKSVKPSLQPAVVRWRKQYATSRPIESRLAAGSTLHDRLIIVDNVSVWLLTQFLNAFAQRSPATIQRSDADTATLKVQAYVKVWESAAPLDL